MVEISEAITVRADTISLIVISLIRTDMDPFLTTITHQWIALAGIRECLKLKVKAGHN